ncbi:MAG: hypothetical protein JSW45_02455, partial [Thiotrichales bacterium]
LAMVTTGCNSADVKNDLTICTEPRPQVCTMDYTPVCGLRNSSAEDEWKTYSNACGACSDATVVGYRPGACESGEN